MNKTIKKLLGIGFIVGVLLATPSIQDQASDPNEPIGGQSVEPTEEETV